MEFYYSFSGSDREGWKLNVYRYLPKIDAVTSHWNEPKIFHTFEELINLYNEFRKEHPCVQEG